MVKTSRDDSPPRPRRKADISAPGSRADVFDAVVVGAGPSGGMAARQLAAAGFRTALLDKKKVVGEPVRSLERGTGHLPKTKKTPRERGFSVKLRG